MFKISSKIKKTVLYYSAKLSGLFPGFRTRTAIIFPHIKKKSVINARVKYNNLTLVLTVDFCGVGSWAILAMASVCAQSPQSNYSSSSLQC